MRLKDRIAIVVGAGQSPGEGVGNGRATALTFAREGAKVLCVDHNLASAEETVDMIRKGQGTAFPFKADVSKESDIKAFVADAHQRWGRIDILHNNVGVSISGGDAELLDITEAAFDRCVAINLKSCILACKAVIPIMRAQKSGAIVNISSMAAITTYPYVAYKATKTAMIAFTEQLAYQNAAHGIRANRLSAAETHALMRAANIDVSTGMVMANIGFYFVVLTSAATLHAHGLTDVQTPDDAARALQPLAGSLASVLFALGVIGTGLLAVPVLAGSVAYAAAELFNWPEGLSRTFRRAPQFYGVIILATLGGVATVFSPLSPIDALVVAAAVNGVIAPVLLVFLMVVAHDRRIMHQHRASGWMLAVGWITTLVMGAAAIGLFASLLA